MKKIFVLAILFYLKQLNACPVRNTYAFLPHINPNVAWWDEIHFCKQDFPASSLEVIVQPNNFGLSSSDHTQHIPISRATTSAPDLVTLGTTDIDLSGLTLADLNLTAGAINADMPSTNQVGDKSLFNFFIYTPRSGNRCDKDKKFKSALNYIQTTPGIFTAAGINSSPDTSSIANAVARIDNALLSLGTGETIPATIIFYHANPYPNQEQWALLTRYCWIGVGAKLQISDSDLSQVVKSGTYHVSVGVRTYP